MEEKASPHIAIVPTQGMGHLIPLLSFAEKLRCIHHFSATFIISGDAPLSIAQTSFLGSLPPSIDYTLLPPVSLDHLPPSAKIETRMSHTIVHSLPSIRHAVKKLLDSGKKIVALVADLFATDSFDVAIEFEIPPYIFFPASSTCLSVLLHLPKLDKMVAPGSEFKEVAGKFLIPGCVPIRGRDLFDPVQDRKDEAYKWALHHAEKYRIAEGIIVNSFKELEPSAIEFLTQKEDGKPTVYPIGPLITTEAVSEVDEDSPPCLKWLDEQPISSVVYVSFGSGGTLSHRQILELAAGLETSEQRFLWVVRYPNDEIANGAYFDSHINSDNPLSFLPENFLERTKDRGLVVPMWAPQTLILAHASVCAFLSHCGWNSTLETVVFGKPVITWPLFAEQRTNAVLLNEEARVAMRPEVGEDGLVGRAEICRVLKGLMEGEEGKGIRNRMAELSSAAAKLLAGDGGCSPVLVELGEKWKMIG